MAHDSRRKKVWLPVFLALALGGGGCSSGVEDGTAARRAAPEFRLQGLDGAEVRLSDFRGKVVLLHFWATWCPPCTAAIPHERELQEKFGGDGLVVVGLSMDRKSEDVREFLQETPVNYPVAIVDAPTRQAYGGIPTVPLTILVGRDGRIRKQAIGYSPEDAPEWERRVRRLLDEEAGAERGLSRVGSSEAPGGEGRPVAPEPPARRG